MDNDNRLVTTDLEHVLGVDFSCVQRNELGDIGVIKSREGRVNEHRKLVLCERIWWQVLGGGGASKLDPDSGHTGLADLVSQLMAVRNHVQSGYHRWARSAKVIEAVIDELGGRIIPVPPFGSSNLVLPWEERLGAIVERVVEAVQSTWLRRRERERRDQIRSDILKVTRFCERGADKYPDARVLRFDHLLGNAKNGGLAQLNENVVTFLRAMHEEHQRLILGVMWKPEVVFGACSNWRAHVVYFLNPLHEGLDKFDQLVATHWRAVTISQGYVCRAEILGGYRYLGCGPLSENVEDLIRSVIAMVARNEVLYLEHAEVSQSFSMLDSSDIGRPK